MVKKVQKAQERVEAKEKKAQQKKKAQQRAEAKEKKAWQALDRAWACETARRWLEVEEEKKANKKNEAAQKEAAWMELRLQKLWAEKSATQQARAGSYFAWSARMMASLENEVRQNMWT